MRLIDSGAAASAGLGALLLFSVGCGLTLPPVPDHNPSLETGRPRGLAVDPIDGSILKAAGGLFRSRDPGQGWQALVLPSALRPARLGLVATSLAKPSRIYAAGPGTGVVRSDDRGQTWGLLSAGLPTQEVMALAVHSSRPDTLYVGLQGQGIFRREDGGERWQKMDDGPPAAVSWLAHSSLEGSMNTGWLYAATPEGPYLSMDCF